MNRLIGEDPDDSPRAMCPYSSMYLPGEFRAVPSLSYRPWGAESVMNYSGGVRPLRRTTRITRAPPILQVRVSNGRSKRSLTTMPGRNLVLSCPRQTVGRTWGQWDLKPGCIAPRRGENASHWGEETDVELDLGLAPEISAAEMKPPRAFTRTVAT